ncbi:endoplasmic reticulum vesicle protein 25 [Powellomyces hirtus]|nr:endoplasmic reticulum vesicle protein 25 [Powellomyces hirtus]
MAFTRPLTIWAVLMVLLGLLSGVAQALKFDLVAAMPGTRRCVAQYITDKQMVVGTVLAADGENQKVDIEVFDQSVHSNKYWHKLNIQGEQKFAFTAHDDAEVHFCFTNTLDAGSAVRGAEKKRTITLHIDTGAEAADLTEEIKNKKLKPVEIELRRLEAILNEVSTEMDELRVREMAMRDVNESTNSRVKWFNTFTLIILIGSGLYQIAYLRRYFQAKKLI